MNHASRSSLKSPTISILFLFLSLLFEFTEGLYVLLAPEKKNTPKPRVPHHLRNLEVTENPEELCPWSLSGPQFPQPTAIQQRYCYPKGSEEYSSTKGGGVWTMYGPNGHENWDFRLLHVYFSGKRAQNKGLSQTEIDEETAKRRADDSTTSVSSASTNGTKRRRKQTVIATQRAQISSWQDPGRYHPRDLGYPPHAYHPMRYHSPPGGGYHPGYNFPRPLPMPPSPLHSRPTHTRDAEAKQSYISPSDSTGRQQDIRRVYSNNAKVFENTPFHPLTSFDEQDVEATVTALSKTGSSAFHSGERTSVFRPRNSLEAGPGHSRNDSQAQIQALLNEDNFDSSFMDLEKDWKNDPELQMNLTFSRDEYDRAGMIPPADVSADRLARRLEDLHRKMKQGILSHPPEERAALVSIIAEWARCLARSPLDPFSQHRRPPQGRHPHPDAVAIGSRGPPVKTEPVDHTAAV
ncbi:MAG: hypothetical protein SGILL_002815 [Bacillariaceae sp.]